MSNALEIIKAIQAGNYTEGPATQRITASDKLAYAAKRLCRPESLDWLAAQVEANKLGIQQARAVALMAYVGEARRDGEYGASCDGSDRDVVNAFASLQKKGLVEYWGAYDRYVWMG